MVVRFLNKVDLGVGVGGYEFALDDAADAKSEIYDAGSKLYESLLESSSLPAGLLPEK